MVNRNEVNLGFAGNCNAAAQAIEADYLIFANQDCKALERGWVEAMLQVFIDHPDAGIVGPRLMFDNGSVQSVGGFFDAGKGPYHRWLGWSNAHDPRISTTMEVSWITGACLMIRREDFLKCGGFNGAVYEGGYFEDVDLCLKMRIEHNKTVWYCAEATLVHGVGSTGGNPKFMTNSARFHAIWDKYIEPDSPFVYVNF